MTYHGSGTGENTNEKGPGTMTFTDAVGVCFKKYVDFNGCASRSEFWWWVLFTVVVSLVCRAVNYQLAWIFSLVTLLPSIAVGVRRLHDTNRGGGWMLLYLLPVIGWIILIVFWVEPGQPSRYATST
jgi:uncharacterized membrane protein YhaH (DUF805 family)